MKRFALPAVLAAACLLLSACAAAPAPTEAPSPVPVETPSPAPVETSSPVPVITTAVPSSSTPLPESRAGKTVLGLVDRVFSEGPMTLRCFIFPGTGPWGLTYDEAVYGDDVKSLLAGYDWQEGKGTLSDWANDTYSVYLWWGSERLLMEVGSDTITYTHEETENAFHATGAETLCDRLTDLWPGPEIRYRRVSPVSSDYGDRQALAERYMAAFGAVYQESGVVTDFALRSVELMDVAASESFLVFRAVYAVKPADRAQPYWKEKRAETDGWVEMRNDIGLVQYTESHWGLEYLDGWDFGE